MAVDYVRKQVMLEKEQSLQLEKIAENDGISFSELIRTLLNSQLRVRIYKEMEIAADELYNDYSNDKDLTITHSLDGEDVIDG
jgi:predicted DNA-binding ribbon-helix-helix protein